MASFKVEISGEAQSEFRSIPFPFRRQIHQRILRLKENPAPPEAIRFADSDDYRLDTCGWSILYSVNRPAQTLRIHFIRK